MKSSSISGHDFRVISGSGRSRYELTLEELHDLLQAMHGLKVVETDCSPMQSAQNSCNEVWRRIAEVRGLDWTTIMPVPSGEPEFFTAKKST